jgi:hypothetical protein
MSTTQLENPIPPPKPSERPRLLALLLDLPFLPLSRGSRPRTNRSLPLPPTRKTTRLLLPLRETATYPLSISRLLRPSLLRFKIETSRNPSPTLLPSLLQPRMDHAHQLLSYPLPMSTPLNRLLRRLKDRTTSRICPLLLHPSSASSSILPRIDSLKPRPIGRGALRRRAPSLPAPPSREVRLRRAAEGSRAQPAFHLRRLARSRTLSRRRWRTFRRSE